MNERKWQWVDDHFGPMGTFTDQEKRRLERNKEFQDGTWRELSAQEMTEFKQYRKWLWYEQS